MGGYAVTAGTVRVRDCPEVQAIVQELERLAADMDEGLLTVKPADPEEHGPGILEVTVNVAGYSSATHACEIDKKVGELGRFALAGARFDSEWEGEREPFYVGSDEQVAEAKSRDALDRIRELIPQLRGTDIAAALQCVVLDVEMPELKRTYLQSEGARCPFCKDRDIVADQVQADGSWSSCEVACHGCGRSWKDVMVLVDMADVRDGDDNPIAE